jgi:hypothetical protein
MRYLLSTQTRYLFIGYALFAESGLALNVGNSCLRDTGLSCQVFLGKSSGVSGIPDPFA